MSGPAVSIDLAAGVAHLGSRTVPVRTVRGGGLAVGDTVLRPLSFGERWRVMETGAVGGAAQIAAAVSAAAAGEPVDSLDAQILALHLAGARTGHSAAPFDRQLAQLAAQCGWSVRDVLDADADIVDRLTDALEADLWVGDDTSDSGWTSIRFAPAQPTAATIAEELIDALAGDLLRRSRRVPRSQSAGSSGRMAPDSTNRASSAGLSPVAEAVLQHPRSAHSSAQPAHGEQSRTGDAAWGQSSRPESGRQWSRDAGRSTRQRSAGIGDTDRSPGTGVKTPAQQAAVSPGPPTGRSRVIGASLAAPRPIAAGWARSADRATAGSATWGADPAPKRESSAPFTIDADLSSRARLPAAAEWPGLGRSGSVEDLEELAGRLADSLGDEADLRGVLR